MTSIMKKRIIYKFISPPLLTFTKKDDPYELRTKSAPPLNILEDKKEQKKYVLCKADGTPISMDDFSDISDSDEVSSVEDISTCQTCLCINEKRKVLLNELLELYKEEDSVPYSFTPINLPQIKYSIDDIMKCEEIQSFTVKLLIKNKIKVPVNFKEFKIGKETILEKANFELNKLTSTNIKKIISNLRQLDLQTVEQAKYIGNLVVFKAINEPQYCLQYAMVVGALKKDFKSKEEKSLLRSQTAFFGTVLTSSLKILEEKIEWADKVTLDKKNYKTSYEYEKAFEEQETERYTKKKKTLGAVDFLCNLYNLDVITLKHIKVRLDEFLKIENEEVIEVLGRFIDKIGEKISLSEQGEYANMICNYLDKNKDKYVNRVKFYIMDVLDRKSKWKKPSNKAGNTFALLEMEDDPIEISNIKNDSSYDDDILKLIGNIYEDLKEVGDEEDEILILDNFAMATEQFGKSTFFSLYFLECIINNRRSQVLINFLIKYFGETLLNKKDISEILESHKLSLKELKIDYPYSVKNYKAILEILKDKDLIDDNIYSRLLIDA